MGKFVVLSAISLLNLAQVEKLGVRFICYGPRRSYLESTPTTPPQIGDRSLCSSLQAAPSFDSCAGAFSSSPSPLVARGQDPFGFIRYIFSLLVFFLKWQTFLLSGFFSP